jgi:ABC-2 type transport system ATP-binding protein
MLDVVERLCERIVILDQGRIVADGRTSELIAASSRGTLDALFRSLTGGDDSKDLAAAMLDAVRPDGLQDHPPQPRGKRRK